VIGTAVFLLALTRQADHHLQPELVASGTLDLQGIAGEREESFVLVRDKFLPVA
jgi:hypothetical protein